MAKKMLIDTTHPEETRVVVADGQRLDEFDFESINKKQLAGNIYLAKVMRVEPSLQACFVDYGGNRHGFLAFSEIHPDYYQISARERAALVASQERAAAAAEERERSDSDEERSDSTRGRRGRSRNSDRDDKRETGSRRTARRVQKPRANSSRSRKRTRDGSYIEREFRIGGGVRVRVINPNDMVDLDLLEREFSIGGSIPVRVLRLTDEERGIAPETPMEEPQENPQDDTPDESGPAMAASADNLDKITSDDAPVEVPESIGGIDEWEDTPAPRIRMRDYKIQDVIKRRQIMLIQINKEERGNKGAAVTTYLSLAGRYCVLMPNTAKGGGISRKITNAPDRKRLKEIAGDLEVPKGMGLIIRTAGAQRTDAEIRRDYEYLLRQWDAVRTLTLDSYAPAAIYEEGSLIKRSIRDLYTKDIDEIIVDGETGYAEAHDYMQMLMPTHAKHVRLHKGRTPLFIEHKVEDQLAAMFNPTVQLKSGGYIVIGVTEALVAVDVNSGRSTRESSIEDTATKTNLEAADEVARQLRLRDLAGLIVIDFIDMNERRNNAAVERRMKDALANDRARIQVGRISSFGLMEMSRQRLRPGMIEATTNPCPHCHGTGLVRSDDTLALTIIREIEEEGLRKSTALIEVKAPVSVANFLHNHKRDRVVDIEQRCGIRVVIEGDPAKVSPDFALTKMKMDDVPDHLRPAITVESATVSMESVYAETDEDEAEPPEQGQVEDVTTREAPRDNSRRRGGRRSERHDTRSHDPLPVLDADSTDDPRGGEPFNYAGDAQENERDNKDGRGNSRRSRRGGRKRNGRANEEPREMGEAAALSMLAGRDALDRALPDIFRNDGAIIVKADAPAKPVETVKPEEIEKVEKPAKPKRKSTRKPKAAPKAEVVEDAPADTSSEERAQEAEIIIEAKVEAEQVAAPEPAANEPAAKPAPKKAASKAKPKAERPTPTPTDPNKPKRSGWWSR